ncbi:MAG: ABC transporter ATP-binding protein [Anaerolineae bacterium]|nr:ABC transporter ATP-binding protein [Anaerolineae bacterium]MDK1080982.1 ABC transporter ATP-binding protein [Anaerolineae bacterium]MDK1117353.1 ABC transporter ATP-binding protein [Anaerolineae bacterium]
MIETHDLSKHFGSFQAVDGVTLSVKPGKILALLGQNGAGKTTTVRMLTALLFPTRGWAKVNGFDVFKQPAQVRASVGVLTEQHGIYVRMTGGEYLNFFGEVYQLDSAARKSRIDYLMDYFGLSEAINQRVGEYSKGMRQKLALARALIHEPPVLLLDEPTSAMDPESAKLVHDEIGRLKSSQRTIIICTHNLVEAEQLADSIAIIYRGKILITGSLDELKQQVLGPIEYEVLMSKPWQPQGLNLPKGVTLNGIKGSRLRFHVERPQELNPILLHQLTKSNAPVVTFQEVPQSLEQVYLKVMADAQAGEVINTHEPAITQEVDLL